MDSTIKIATININRLKSDEKREKLYQFCKSNHLDVICFQEINFNECIFMQQEYNLITNFQPNKMGVGFAIKKELKCSEIFKDGEGRIIKCKIEGLNIINIYAPSGREKREERKAFFSKNILPYLHNLKETTVFLGDFNSIEHEHDAKIKKQRRNSKIINKEIKELIKIFKLKDAWLAKGGKRVEHTFFYPKGSSRIDRVYIDEKGIEMIRSIKYAATELSDHLAIIMETTYRKPERIQTTSLWRMNSKILKDPFFIQTFNEWWEGISRFKIKENKNREWWDRIFKPGLKRISIDCSKRMARTLKEKRLNDQILMEDIIEKINKGEDLYNELKETKKSIKKWEKSVASGILFKNKDKDKMMGEPCTLHHFKIKNNATNNIKTLEINGTLTENEDKIKSEIENYFKNIFEREGYKYKGNEFIDIIKTQELNSKIDEQIKEDEIKFVLDKCKKEKSPGIDGIPYEFYQEFWPLIKTNMTNLFNEIILNEEMTKSQCLAAIKLIPKTANPQKLSDFRPISLLCTDYKILSGVMAERLKPLLPKVIHESQKGGVPERSLFSSLSLVRDITARIGELNRVSNANDLVGLSKVNAALVAIDFEKAYDLVQREFLWEIMQKMGFSRKFIGILKGLYKSCKLKIIHGGTETIEIEGKNSIRQGCPLSMHLFTIFIDPLVRMIDFKIKGFKHGKERAAARAFVDDVNVIVTNENDILKMNDILNEFCIMSGANFNRNKTCIFGLGGWEGRTKWPIPWIETKPSMKILGLEFYPKLEVTINRNWTEIMRKITGQLTKNANRQLTLHQRNYFIKSFILPQALHAAKILPCPEKIAEKIKRNMQKFIWYGKAERPPPGTQIAPEKEGGLAFIHPGHFFKATLTKTIINILEEDDGLEKELLAYWTHLHIKDVTRLTRTNAPRSFYLPSHLQEPVKKMKEWHEETNEKLSAKVSTKELYLQWAKKNAIKGKLETGNPNLICWARAWKNHRKMAPPEKEIVFMINHDILPNMTRLKRMKMTPTWRCPYCLSTKETNLHLFVTCLKKRKAIRNFKTQINQPAAKAFRGDVSGEKEVYLTGKFLLEIWKARKKKRIPEWPKKMGREKGRVIN